MSTRSSGLQRTTAASNGSVNSMHDSFSPLGGMVPLWLMQLGEVIYGGVGSGLYGMLAFVIIAVFVAGLMVGRTPEYLGKKIEAYEMKMSTLIILIPVLLLLGNGDGRLLPQGTSSVLNPGPHGFSEILYAFSSAGQQRQRFCRAERQHRFLQYRPRIGHAFRPLLACHSSPGDRGFSRQEKKGSGQLRHPGNPYAPFYLMAYGGVLIVGALSFLPALALGPIVEHLLLY